MGELSLLFEKASLYIPLNIAKSESPLTSICIPHFDPKGKTEVCELSPGQVLTEFLGYCFPPFIPEEKFFDNVIEILERVKIYRLNFGGISDRIRILQEIIGA